MKKMSQIIQSLQNEISGNIGLNDIHDYLDAIQDYYSEFFSHSADQKNKYHIYNVFENSQDFIDDFKSIYRTYLNDIDVLNDDDLYETFGDWITSNHVLDGEQPMFYHPYIDKYYVTMVLDNTPDDVEDIIDYLKREHPNYCDEIVDIILDKCPHMATTIIKNLNISSYLKNKYKQLFTASTAGLL